MRTVASRWACTLAAAAIGLLLAVVVQQLPGAEAPRVGGGATGTPAALAPDLVIPLWDGVAPGSEGWTQVEEAAGATVRNVVKPTLTAYPAEPAVANGTAVIVCPGGAFRALSWQDEGVQAAKWLNAHGITAFVLKYRLLDARARGGGMAPPPRNLEIKNANANPEPDNKELANVINLATSDGRQAIKLVRKNAASWGINPKRIGIMGFSAGGGVAVGSALGGDPDGRPDFVATLYGPALVDVNVPADAGPLFIAVAADHMPVSAGCVALYSVWKAAGKSAELHVYAGGRAGFGMRKQGLPSDTWVDRYYDWLRAQGFCPEVKPK
jgi:dienelactone hydrolase